MPRDNPRMSEEKAELVKRAADAWNEDDLEAFLAVLDPDIEWHTSIERFFEGPASTFRGHTGIRQFWASYRGEVFERLEVRMDEFRDAGESLLTLGHIMTVGQTSGLELASELAQLWTFRRGKIASSRDFLSHADGLKAAGLDA